MAIERFPLLDTFTSATVLAVNKDNVDYRCLPNTFVEWLQDTLQSGDGMVTRYATPVSGGTVYLLDSAQSQWLVITPTTSLGTLTLVLPAAGNCVEGQEILVNCTQAISLLTINTNGGAVAGVSSIMTANGFFRIKFEPVQKIWYRIG